MQKITSEDFALIKKHFYRTRVRSLGMLVSDSLTDSLTHSLTDSCLVNLHREGLSVTSWDLSLIMAARQWNRSSENVKFGSFAKASSREDEQKRRGRPQGGSLASKTNPARPQKVVSTTFSIFCPSWDASELPESDKGSCCFYRGSDSQTKPGSKTINTKKRKWIFQTRFMKISWN